MSSKDCNLLCWNVRGLNDGAKRASGRNQIISTGATIVCFQETKNSNWTQSLLVAGGHGAGGHDGAGCACEGGANGSGWGQGAWMGPGRRVGVWLFLFAY